MSSHQVNSIDDGKYKELNGPPNKGLVFSIGLTAKDTMNGAKTDDSARDNFIENKYASTETVPKQLSSYQLKSISDLQKQCFNSLLALDSSLINNKSLQIIKDRKGFKTKQLERQVNFIPVCLIGQSKSKKDSAMSDDDQSINSKNEGKTKAEFTYSSKTDNLEISKKLDKYRNNNNDIVNSYYQMYSLNNSTLKEEFSSSDILQKACLPKDLLSFNHKNDSNSSSFLSQSNCNIYNDQNKSAEVAALAEAARTIFEKSKDCIMPSVKADDTNFEEPHLKNIDLLMPQKLNSNSINYDVSPSILSNCKSNIGGNQNVNTTNSNTIIPISPSDPFYYQQINNNMIGAQNYYPGFYQSIPYQSMQYHYPHTQGQVIYPVSYPYVNNTNTFNPLSMSSMPMNLGYNYQINPQISVNPKQHSTVPLNGNQNYFCPKIHQPQYQASSTIGQPTPQIVDSKQIDLGKISILKAIRDQQECRNLQILIDKNPSMCKTVILPQLLQYFVVFCSDPFGNYLVQKVMAKLQPEDFEQITQKLIENFKDLSLHNFGTRVVQRFLELANQTYLDRLKDSVQNYLFILYKNQNGIHVITKFTLYSTSNQFVYDFLMSNLTAVCKNQEGCCMIQKILEGEITEKKVNSIFLSLLDSAV